jgi:sugar lactone lactonase YvrE
VARYNIPDHPLNSAAVVAVSPDGSMVFVTGTASAVGRPQAGTWWATIAYAAATGRRLWVARYQGPAKGISSAAALAVSPDGSTVFVGGISDGLSGEYDAVTVAYNAATGAMMWAARQVSGGLAGNRVDSLAVSPDGSSVYMTGETSTPDGATEATTAAYGAATGTTLWTSTYGVPGSEFGGVAVSPDGSTVYASGSSNGGAGTVAITTAYRQQRSQMQAGTDHAALTCRCECLTEPRTARRRDSIKYAIEHHSWLCPHSFGGDFRTRAEICASR